MARRKTRRKGKRKAKQSGFGNAVIAVAVVMLALVVLAVLQAAWQWANEHRVLVTTVGLFVAVGVALGAVQRLRARQLAEDRQAERERAIASTDDLTGPEFEEWMGRLLTRTGFRDVAVGGGSGDLGADVTATAPDGRKTVIQCKRWARNVGSAEMQRFAGTCRNVHKAELAVFITTSGFSKPARALAEQVDIVLVDRAMLSDWAAEQRLPTALLDRNPPRPQAV